eukprot:5944443-Lingulodinium_polyedra.AAC.1
MQWAQSRLDVRGHIDMRRILAGLRRFRLRHFAARVGKGAIGTLVVAMLQGRGVGHDTHVALPDREVLWQRLAQPRLDLREAPSELIR